MKRQLYSELRTIYETAAFDPHTFRITVKLKDLIDGAVLRAAEIHADAILLAKNIDGVYSADPKLDPTAVKFDRIRYDEVLAKRLAVMDSTATSLAMDNAIPVIVFALAEPENILRVLAGEAVGTTVE